MEELKLDDLAEFGDGFELFPASDEELADLGDEKPKEGEKEKELSDDQKAAAKKVAEESKSGKDKEPSDQESVAKDKDKSQVQAGKTATGDEGSDSSSPKLNDTEQLYSKLATKFKAEGVLPGLEDTATIKSLEDLESAIKKEVESRFDSRTKAIEEAMNVGLPAGEIAEKMEVIENLKKIDEAYLSDDKNVDFRKTAIAQDFISKGYGKERAEVMAQRSVDAGTDVEDATFALKSIIDTEENSLKSTIDAAKAKETKSITDVKDYIEKNKEVVPGIPLTDAQGEELYKQITTDLGNKENAFMRAQKKDPVGSRVKLEAIFFLTKGLTDFSVFGKTQESDISKNIENLLRGTSFTESGTVQTEIQDDNANFSLKDLKDLEIE